MPERRLLRVIKMILMSNRVKEKSREPLYHVGHGYTFKSATRKIRYGTERTLSLYDMLTELLPFVNGSFTEPKLLGYGTYDKDGWYGESTFVGDVPVLVVARQVPKFPNEFYVTLTLFWQHVQTPDNIS